MSEREELGVPKGHQLSGVGKGAVRGGECHHCHKSGHRV